MEFFAGLIFGAILGVAADRVWSRFESRPKFEITSGCFHAIHNREGYNFEVRNAGRHEIPAYLLVLFHPLRGSWDFLRADDEDQPLLPGQIRKHSFPLMKNGQPHEFVYNYMMHEKDEPVTNPKPDDFILRIVMHKSDCILFESPKIGRAYARAILRTYENGRVGHRTWEEAMEMRTPTPVTRKCWNWTRRKIGWKTAEEKGFDNLMKEHELKEREGQQVT